MTDPNPTPPAVRLARFVWPDATMPFPWRSHGNRSECGYTDTRRGGYFSVHNLNDLALAEQKVCAAGLGADLRRAAEAELQRQLPEGHQLTEYGLNLLLYTAPAATRAAALVAVLDSHPELEKQ